jgi:hypothetical protein
VSPVPSSRVRRWGEGGRGRSAISGRRDFTLSTVADIANTELLVGTPSQAVPGYAVAPLLAVQLVPSTKWAVKTATLLFRDTSTVT